MALTHFVRNAVRFATTVRRKTPQSRSVADSAQPLPIFVINLERSDNRRRFILRHLNDLGLEGTVFPAVDGRTLNLEQVEREGAYREALALEKFSRPLSLAEIGCALSHLRLYAMLVRQGIDRALVLEDDAMLVPDAPLRLAALLETLPDGWDVVQLIYECRDVEPAGTNLVRFRMKSSMPVAAAAYLISRSGAQKMIEHAYPIHYPADSLLGRSPRWGAAVYGASPHLVTINNVFPSNISATRTFKSRVSKAAKEVLVRLLD